MVPEILALLGGRMTRDDRGDRDADLGRCERTGTSSEMRREGDDPLAEASRDPGLLGAQVLPQAPQFAESLETSISHPPSTVVSQSIHPIGHMK